jgi:hypothetical protein
MQDLNGRTLGHYRFVDKIGKRGMGEGYHLHDGRLEVVSVAGLLADFLVASAADRLGLRAAM